MGSYSWIYVDHINNIWRFSLNDNKELYYNVMYKEGKWTKEKIVDKDVLSFSFYKDEGRDIHIVYSNTNAEIKYCTLKDDQWMGRTLYKMKKDMSEIYNLKVYISGQKMHIFYLIIESDGRDHGVLMHLIWNGKETSISKLRDIILTSNVKENYLVKIDRNGIIHMFFITDEGNEISLNYCSYQGHKWTSVRRLYGISGEDIGFEMIKDQQGMQILNKFTENSIYYLDHVIVKTSGNVEELRVHESINELSEPILFKVNNKLYSCWLEENKIYYAFFDGESWSGKTCFNMGNENNVKKYHFCNALDKENNIRDKDVYGTGKLDFNLIIPSQFAIDANSILKSEIDQVDENQVDENEKKDPLQMLKIELSHAKADNLNLEKTIASLNMQLDNKKKILEDYEKQVMKTIHQKQKADENYDVFMELQQKLQSELESLKAQLIEEKNCNINVENKLKELGEENIIIRNQVEILTEENIKLSRELEMEKNQSIMERILKRSNSSS